MDKLIKFLEGKKTYILVGLALAVELCFFFGVIEVTTRNELLVLLGVGGMATVRDAINKMSK